MAGPISSTLLRKLGIGWMAASALAAGYASPSAGSWIRDGVPVCTESHAQSEPVIVSDGAGGAIVAWVDTRNGASDVFAQRVDSTGATLWSSNGVAVCTAVLDQLHPAAAPFGGGAVVFWLDTRTGLSEIFGQRLDAAGIAQWTFNGIPLSTTNFFGFSALEAISDGSSGITQPTGWIVAWHEETHDADGMRVQHVDATGGNLWTPASEGGVTLVNRSGGNIGNFSMVTDGVGIVSAPKGAVVTWHEFSPSTSDDIYVRRVNGAGIPQWSATGVPVCVLTGTQLDPKIANVGGGNTVIVWQDGRTSDADVYAQKLNSSGATQWLANGLPACRAPGPQVSPQVVSDGAGGTFVAWEDHRGAVGQVYAQRLDGNGQPLWDLDGIPVGPASGAQKTPRLVSDNAGGVIAVWSDKRLGSSFNLYAQRLDAAGNRLWIEGGVPLSIGGNVGLFDVVGNGASGALAAWADVRSGTADVYANRIVASGGVVDVPLPSPGGLRLALDSPNPAPGAVRVRLDLPYSALVRADVLDAAGRRVRSLVAGSRLDPGPHVLAWDGRDETGGWVRAGVYFVVARTERARRTARLVVLH